MRLLQVQLLLPSETLSKITVPTHQIRSVWRVFNDSLIVVLCFLTFLGNRVSFSWTYFVKNNVIVSRGDDFSIAQAVTLIALPPWTFYRCLFNIKRMSQVLATLFVNWL